VDAATRDLIAALHHAPYRYVLAVTGGGAGAAAALLNVPGGSRTVLEIVVPYHEQALADFLGRLPDRACSAAAARDLAARAWQRACWLAPGAAAVGAACTASLATDRPKRGDHRFHVAVHDGAQSAVHSLTLTKGARDRPAEEAVLDAVLLNALAAALGVAARLEPALLPGEAVQVETLPEAHSLSAWLAGEGRAVCQEVDGRLRADAPRPAVVLPGSFNPAHAGHWLLAEAAARRLQTEVAFEVSVRNVDKPPLSADEVRRRLGPFTWRAPVWLTKAPTFAEKAELFPGAVFVVGADTAARVVAARYYEDSEARAAAALGRIRARGCRFLVAGRADAAGRFVGLDRLAVPAAWRDLFAGLPEGEFRLDLSSTELRAREASP
jgi:hypothetical protein